MLPRYLGGRGLMDIGNQLNQQIANMRSSYHQNQAENSIKYRPINKADGKISLELFPSIIAEYMELKPKKLKSQ